MLLLLALVLGAVARGLVLGQRGLGRLGRLLLALALRGRRRSLAVAPRLRLRGLGLRLLGPAAGQVFLIEPAARVARLQFDATDVAQRQFALAPDLLLAVVVAAAMAASAWLRVPMLPAGKRSPKPAVWASAGRASSSKAKVVMRFIMASTRETSAPPTRPRSDPADGAPRRLEILARLHLLQPRHGACELVGQRSGHIELRRRHLGG